MGFILSKAGTSCAFGPARIEWSWRDFSYMCITPTSEHGIGPGVFGIALGVAIVADVVALRILSTGPREMASGS